MAGGTGGHVFPALAVAELLRERGAEVFWIGTRRGMESRLVPGHGLPIEWIRVEGLRRRGLVPDGAAPFELTGACWPRPGPVLRPPPGLRGAGHGRLRLRTRRRGRASLGIPLVVHEQNSVPGLTNRWLARIASRVLEAFPGSFGAERRALACGNPVRVEIANLPAPATRFVERSGPLRLLVLGGSLGAKALNETGVPAALALLPSRICVRRFGTRPDRARWSWQPTAYAEAGVEAEVTPFLADMAGAYAWADLVVCRAGTLTVSELAAAGVGSILVPYPHAVDDHQVSNARFWSTPGRPAC